MTTTADGDGQDKKDDKWPDRVTVRKWIAGQKMFIDPVKDVKAKFKEIGKTEKKLICVLEPVSCVSPPTVGSEITDKDGVVWVVTKANVGGGTDHLCHIDKKAPDKKPD